MKRLAQLAAPAIVLAATGAAAISLCAGRPAAAQELSLSGDQMLDLAASEQGQGRWERARALLEALREDPSPPVRREARYRLALLLGRHLGHWREAAVELRRVLDEQPDALPVRLELARVLAQLGDRAAAQREVRFAAALPLPPEAERLVRFYAQSLRGDKRIGGAFELALAPDSNINRATRSDTLDTALGQFVLNEDARATSGLGAVARGSAYGRVPVSASVTVLGSVSGSATEYRGSAFDDRWLDLRAGPEITFGARRVTVQAGPAWRWYGGRPFTRSVGVTAIYDGPAGRQGHVRGEVSAGHTTNFRNAEQTGATLAASISLDRALSVRTGIGLSAGLDRSGARAPAYRLTSAHLDGYIQRTAGRTTLVSSLGVGLVEADAAIPLLVHRRSDRRVSAMLAATLRQFTWAGFAPLVRLRWERNRSTVPLYAYTRRAAEIGVTRAF